MVVFVIKISRMFHENNFQTVPINIKVWLLLQITLTQNTSNVSGLRKITVLKITTNTRTRYEKEKKTTYDHNVSPAHN